ncbi:MAG: exodeoxyribonuclease VII large subunit [Candidatus Omnitrophica bacterium]|nr:exodeoxyribonuclease VII large subunit [Candidatus Omnitrophota bacterium]
MVSARPVFSKEGLELLRQEEGFNKPLHIWTVSELTRNIRLILETSFSEVWVEGEISGLKRIPTGTIFFNLKDDLSLLKCVVFASITESMRFNLEDGLKVICLGYVSVYDKRGEYQLYVQRIEPKGIGSLQLALEQLKKKLEKEGLFRIERKRPIPYLPSCIGIVTSLSGAAIKDILKVLEERYKDVHIIINPVRVQGEMAKEEIASAINDFNLFNHQLPLNERIEVLIVGRGGGSIEDLWAFNEEVVARAIYNSRIPVISAVGHERDITIADLVADLRAPTPSVAAEMVIPKKEELRKKIKDISEDLRQSFLDLILRDQQVLDDLIYRLGLIIQHNLELNLSQLQAAKKKLIFLNPLSTIQQYKERIEDLKRQLFLRIDFSLKLKQSEFNSQLKKLSSLSPLNVLSRGYSITFKIPQETIVKESRDLKKNDLIKTKLFKGQLISKVVEVREDESDKI